MPESLRLAFWSGPRNISTALMRSWGNRSDTYVCDEPLYAHYLLKGHGLDHPCRDEVMQHHDTDADRVVGWLSGPVPEGRRVFYQKHMSHHLLPDVDRAWLDCVTHAFLIRDPREMLTSFIQVVPDPQLSDTGLPQQLEIYERVKLGTGRAPPIVDSADLLREPAGMLARVCAEIGLPFEKSMLSWPPGRRETDGIWAKSWYDSVERSTAFNPYRPKPDQVPQRLADLHRECQRYYDELWEQRIRLE